MVLARVLETVIKQDFLELQHIMNWVTNLVYNNQLSELPESLSEMEALECLGIAGNNINRLPDSMADLQNLKQLFFNLDPETPLSLKRFPDCIHNSKQLEHLTFLACELEVLPDWLGELSQLKNLNVSHNSLTNIPISLVQLEGLGNLDLTYNPLNLTLAEVLERGVDAVKAHLLAKAGN